MDAIIVTKHSNLRDKMRLGLVAYQRLESDAKLAIRPETFALVIDSLLEQGYTISKTLGD